MNILGLLVATITGIIGAFSSNPDHYFNIVSTLWLVLIAFELVSINNQLRASVEKSVKDAE